jgi:hypothetical protein
MSFPFDSTTARTLISSTPSFEDAEFATLAAASATAKASATTIAVCGEVGMVRKKPKQSGRTARTPISDEKLIARLQEEAPELLTPVSEPAFDTVIDNLLKESPSDDRPHFYCRLCGEYHLKTHAHHAEMKRRKSISKQAKKSPRSHKTQEKTDNN